MKNYDFSSLTNIFEYEFGFVIYRTMVCKMPTPLGYIY